MSAKVGKKTTLSTIFLTKSAHNNQTLQCGGVVGGWQRHGGVLGGVLSGRRGMQRGRLAMAAARTATGCDSKMRIIATTRCNTTARCARGRNTDKIDNQPNKAGATRGKDATQLQDNRRRNDET
jgi:hypothetical protein